MTEQQKEVEKAFAGFAMPTSNFFHAPNNFTDICADINNLAELKIVFYVMRHTWGFQEYGIFKTISTDEFMRGRKYKDGSRMDTGTGLSEPSVKDGVKRALEHGYIVCHVDESDKGRTKKSYALKMADGVRILPPQESYPQGSNILPPENKDLTPRGQTSYPRSEKETLERNSRKKLQKEKKYAATDAGIPQITTTAPADYIDLKKLTEEEIALIQAYRQGALKVNSLRSEKIGGAAASVPESKQAEEEVLTAPPSVASTSGLSVSAALTDETIVAHWEGLRDSAYGKRERAVQVRAAKALQEMELPSALSLDLLQQIYETYFDDFWKGKYGELHLSHLIEKEKSSGQIRIIRWLNRLRFQSLPGSSKPNEPRQPVTSKPKASMSRDEAVAVVGRAMADGKQYGYHVQAEATPSKKVASAWIVKVQWEEVGYTPTIFSLRQWQEFFENEHKSLQACKAMEERALAWKS